MQPAKSFLIFFLAFLSLKVTCQYSLSGFSLEEDTDQWYSEHLGKKNEDIFNGDYYVVRVRSKDDHKFYKDFRWQKGAIEIDDKLYENIDLLYDLIDDLIILRNESLTELVPLKPLQKRVSQFIIKNTVFVNILDKNPPPKGKGFYQLIHSGTHLLFVRRLEKLETYGKVQSNEYTYLRYEGRYYLSKSRKTLYKLFPEFKKQIKVFAKQKKLRFDKQNFDGSMAVVLDYVENLIDS